MGKVLGEYREFEGVSFWLLLFGKRFGVESGVGVLLVWEYMSIEYAVVGFGIPVYRVLCI